MVDKRRKAIKNEIKETLDYERKMVKLCSQVQCTKLLEKSK